MVADDDSSKWWPQDLGCKREKEREKGRKKEREICEDAIREVIDEKNKRIVAHQ